MALVALWDLVDGLGEIPLTLYLSVLLSSMGISCKQGRFGSGVCKLVVTIGCS